MRGPGRAPCQRGRGTENEQRERGGQWRFEGSDRGWLKLGTKVRKSQYTFSLGYEYNYLKSIIIQSTLTHFLRFFLPISVERYWVTSMSLNWTKAKANASDTFLWEPQTPKICRGFPALPSDILHWLEEVSSCVKIFCERKLFFCVSSVWMWVHVQRLSQGAFQLDQHRAGFVGQGLLQLS